MGIKCEKTYPAGEGSNQGAAGRHSPGAEVGNHHPDTPLEEEGSLQQSQNDGMVESEFAQHGHNALTHSQEPTGRSEKGALATLNA